MKNCKALSYIARNIRLVSGKFVMTTNSRAITSPGVFGLSVKHKYIFQSVKQVQGCMPWRVHFLTPLERVY